jgi:hypothetical protein
MSPDTLAPPKLSRRWIGRRPHRARCRHPWCRLSVDGQGPEFDAIVSAHVLETGHRVEVIRSDCAIVSLPEGSSG